MSRLPKGGGGRCTSRNRETLFSTRCGDCCKGFGGTYVSSEDVQTIAAFIHVDPQQFLEKYCQPSGKKFVLAQAENGYCVFWKDRICTIHPVKPKMCRVWPFIPSILVDPNNWNLMASVCPGMRTNYPDDVIANCVRKKILSDV